MKRLSCGQVCVASFVLWLLSVFVILKNINTDSWALWHAVLFVLDFLVVVLSLLVYPTFKHLSDEFSCAVFHTPC